MALVNLCDGGSDVLEPLDEGDFRDDDHRLPAWRRIERTIQSEIASKILVPGQQLPPENDVAGRFGVSRLTARKALASLQQQGFIRIEPGRGTFVQDTIFPYEIGPETRFCHYLESVNAAPRNDLLSSRVEIPQPPISRELGLSSMDKVLVLEVLGSADDRPLFFSRNYFPERLLPGLRELYSQTGSITTSLKSLGVLRKKRIRSEFISRMPTPKEARLLRQPKTRPVTQLEITTADETGRPIWLEVNCFAADRVRFIAKV